MNKYNKKKSKKKTKKKKRDALRIWNERAAGIDIGDEEIWVAVPVDRDEEPTRVFATFTTDLNALVTWLQACGIETVAMEATGIYWMALHDLLETAGIEVFVVNGDHVKNIHGKKDDEDDCEWIQRLHTYGLLRSSFHPEKAIRGLRMVVRHRRMLVDYRSSHILHMQKALQLMNLKLSLVIRDITGLTGLRIIRAIVAGEHDPLVLARFRDPRCAHSQTDIAKALTGQYQPPHLFTLKQALALYDYYSALVAECDLELEKMYAQFATSPPAPEIEAPPVKKQRRRKHDPHFDLRHDLFRIYGVDLVAVPGLDLLTVQTLFSEIGTDMTQWPSVKHFASWLGLAPNHRISGGQILSRHTHKNKNRAAAALRLAAQSLARSQTHLGDFYRQVKARRDAPKAITATAHKLARIIYCMLSRRTSYQPPDRDKIAAARAKRTRQRLEKQAQKLGLELVPTSSG